MFFNGWEFSAREYKEDVIFEVIPNKEIIIPENLSKYYELNQRNVIAFVNNQFYVSHPENLNDLFEFNSELIDFSELDFNHFKDLFDAYAENSSVDLKEDFENKPQEYLKEIRNLFYTKFISSFGVLCITDNQYNDLMWAHYTNNKGFLVEYKIKKFNKKVYKGPFPINYVSKLKSHKFNKNDVIFEGFFSLFMTKKEIWRYENEFRFFCTPNLNKLFKVDGRFSNINDYPDLQDRFVNYPEDSINKIILGFDFYKDDIVSSDDLRSTTVNFSGNEGLLKSKLFDEIIKRKLKVEIVGISKSNFDLGSIPINISHLNGFKYSIKEII